MSRSPPFGASTKEAPTRQPPLAVTLNNKYSTAHTSVLFAHLDIAVQFRLHSWNTTIQTVHIWSHFASYCTWINKCGLPCNKGPSCILFEICFSGSNSYICAECSYGTKNSILCASFCEILQMLLMCNILYTNMHIHKLICIFILNQLICT